MKGIEDGVLRERMHLQQPRISLVVQEEAKRGKGGKERAKRKNIQMALMCRIIRYAWLMH